MRETLTPGTEYTVAIGDDGSYTVFEVDIRRVELEDVPDPAKAAVYTLVLGEYRRAMMAARRGKHG